MCLVQIYALFFLHIWCLGVKLLVFLKAIFFNISVPGLDYSYVIDLNKVLPERNDIVDIIL